MQSPSSPTGEPVNLALESVQWTDFVEGDNGKAEGVFDTKWKEF